MIKIKICGNHQDQDLLTLSAFKEKISYIGFIFTPLSKRYVQPQKVVEWLRKYPLVREKSVAVFLDQELEEIKAIIKETGIPAVQLHGNESISLCQALRHLHLEVWKVFPVEEGEAAANIEEYLDVIDVLLLDTKLRGKSGGTGKTFDWAVIPGVKEKLSSRPIPLYIAGGVNPDNVAELTRQYPIDGIDLASGVEENGYKQKQKIDALVRGVEQNENQ